MTKMCVTNNWVEKERLRKYMFFGPCYYEITIVI